MVGQADGNGSAEKYQVLFDQASDAVLTVLPDGQVDDANRAAEDLTGFLKEELVGSAVRSLSPDAKTQHVPNRARVLSLEQLASPGTYEDIAVLRKDGYVRLVDLTVRRVSSAQGPMALILLRDVSEKKRMERELITQHAELRKVCFELERKNAELTSMQETLVQAGKMAALGELAFGIAHELNQPLQGIRGYAQELESILEHPSSEVTSGLKEIVSNVDKMSGIIDYLRTHVRKSGEKFEMTSVHRAIDESMKMLSRQFKVRGIEVTRDFGAEVSEIYANPLQLEQVFINLATNARDAIEASGRGSGHVSVRTRFAGDFVEIEFRDDGCGMSERTKTKAFNPFFTTKEVGKGMGMGLSLSYGVISKLHGSIVVETEAGKGTAFTIRLPRDYRELA